MMLSLAATLGIIGVGLVIVVGSILGFRLHAFLALILAALSVSLLTPRATVEWYELQRTQFKNYGYEEGELVLRLAPSAVNQTGKYFLIMQPHPETGLPEAVGTVRVSEFEQTSAGSLARVEFEPASAAELEIDGRQRLLVTPDVRSSALAFAKDSIGNRIGAGFGNTCTGIGILIALAAIIGKCMLDSGAADKIVRWTLRLVGEKNAPVSFVLSGFALSVPVFFDTVFYLMIPLGKAMRVRTGRNYLLYVMSMVTGAAVAHSLVPPTPGPLFVAEELGVDIGLMILVGSMIGLVTSLVGFTYAMLVCRFADLPLRETADFSLKDLEHITQRDEKDLPAIGMAVLPIILPVLLIAGSTVVDTIVKGVPSGELSPLMLEVKAGFDLFGNKNIAMAIAAVLSIVMLIQQRKTDLTELAQSLQSALASGGVIILITAAGGAFGRALQQTNIANMFGSVSGASPAAILGIAFLVTGLVRFAQGSATVSMITGVGVMASFAAGGDLGFHPVYLALAIGFGSKILMWMNDSGFWVIGKMSGMTELETLKYISPLLTIMGCFGVVLTIIIATFFPMA